MELIVQRRCPLAQPSEELIPVVSRFCASV